MEKEDCEGEKETEITYTDITILKTTELIYYLKTAILTITLFISLMGNILYAQKNVTYYIEQARVNSPLIRDNQNQSEAARLEIDRLRAFYKKSQISVTGNYTFAPIISRDNGRSELVLNSPGADNYSGYDIAASNAGVYQGLINYNQPLFNNKRYQAYAQQAEIGAQINRNTINLTRHDLEKTVTDQYILCLLDLRQVDYATSMLSLMQDQKKIMDKLVESGLVKSSDITLMNIEAQNFETQRITFIATYKRDLMDMNIMSGIADTSRVALEDISLSLKADSGSSHYLLKYRLDSLNFRSAQKVFEQKYIPQVSLFGNAGLNAVYAPTIPNRLGMSAGFSLFWNITDGHQRLLTQKKTIYFLNTVSFSRDLFVSQNTMRRNRILNEITSYDARLVIAKHQLDEYQAVLAAYRREMLQGQLSVINFIAVLKNMGIQQRDYLVLQTNKQLLINMYNYWNW